MIKKIIKTLFFVIFLYFLLKQISFADILLVIRTIKPFYLLLGFFIYLILQYLRSLRLMIILNLKHKNIFTLIRITIKHAFYVNVLPFRLGEVSMLGLLKKDLNRSYSEGIYSLFVSRLYDIFAIVLIGLTSSLLWSKVQQTFFIILIFLAIIGVYILAVLLPFFIDLAMIILKKMLKFKILPKKMLTYINTKSSQLNKNFNTINSIQTLNLILLSSICLWLSMYAIYFMLTAVELKTPFGLFSFAVSFAFLANIIPANVFGTFGTQEVGWAAGFILLGVTESIAVSTGIVSHFVVLFYSTLSYGLMCIFNITKIIMYNTNK